MDITNPVLFEVLAERPRLRASRRQFAVAHAFSRSAFSRTAFPLPRGALVGGSNRRPFPRVAASASSGVSPEPAHTEPGFLVQPSAPRQPAARRTDEHCTRKPGSEAPEGAVEAGWGEAASLGMAVILVLTALLA